MHLSFFIFTLVRARPNDNEEYPSYEICKFFQEDRIDETYEALGLNNQWPRLEKDPQVDFQCNFSCILLFCSSEITSFGDRPSFENQ